MKESNLDNEKLIKDLTELYHKLGENVSREKRTEILSFLIRLIKDTGQSITEELYNDIKLISKKLAEDAIDYAKRQDFMPMSLCANTLKHVANEPIIKDFTDTFINNINNGWKEFLKSEEFVSLIFDIANLCEGKGIEEFRDRFTRLFLNTLLELRDNPGMKFRASLNTALYLKNVGMDKQSNDLAHNELKNLPVKFFIQRFQDICNLLIEYELFTKEVVKILLERIKKNITEEFRDDLFIHIANSYYTINNIERLLGILQEFRDKERAMLTLLHFIEEDIKGLEKTEDKFEKKVKIFYKLHDLFNDQMKGDNPVLHHHILSIQKIIDIDKYRNLLKERIDRLKSMGKVDPEMYSQLLQSII
jgi:hypothetical protein